MDWGYGMSGFGLKVYGFGAWGKLLGTYGRQEFHSVGCKT